MIRLWLADVVVLVHFAFVIYIAVGGFIAWRWPRTIYIHLVAVAWGIGMLLVGYSCPLTILERDLRGEGADTPGFIDRYVEGILYPEEFTPHLRALMTVGAIVSYAGFRRLRSRRRPQRGLEPASDQAQLISRQAGSPQWSADRSRT